MAHRTLAAALAGGLLLVGCQQIGTTVDKLLGPSASTSTLAPADAEFARRMGQGSNAEVALGELAQANAAAPEVKAFGRKMIRDYRRLGEEIGAIMRRHGLTPPTKPSEPERAAVAALAAQTGPAFDQAYLAQQAQAHAMTLSQFQRTAEGPDASAVRGFARRETDTIRGHLEYARSLLRRMQAGS